MASDKIIPLLQAQKLYSMKKRLIRMKNTDPYDQNEDSWTGTDKDAINCYNEALKLNPSLARAWCSKGYALIKLKKYEESHACLDEALRINPRYAPCWTIKGWAFNSQNKHKDALVYLDRAIELDPHYMDAWYQKHLALKDLNRKAEADVALAKARELGFTG